MKSDRLVMDNSIRRRLPKPEFLYTIDQIAMIMSVDEAFLKKQHLYYEGRSVGLRNPDHMRAVNIAAADKTPVWRVNEKELKRWMRRKGFSWYSR